MKPVQYEARWGTRVRLVTVVVLLLAFGSAVFVPMVTEAPAARLLRWLLPLLMTLVFGFVFLFRVRSFELSDDALRVQRGAWQNCIPLDGLESVTPDPEALRGARKIYGNDGLFAVHGYFRSRRLGRFHVFVTDVEKSVVLRWPNRLVVVSPDEPARFIRDLQRRLEQRKEGR